MVSQNGHHRLLGWARRISLRTAALSFDWENGLDGWLIWLEKLTTWVENRSVSAAVPVTGPEKLPATLDGTGLLRTVLASTKWLKNGRRMVLI